MLKAELLAVKAWNAPQLKLPLLLASPAMMPSDQGPSVPSPLSGLKSRPRLQLKAVALFWKSPTSGYQATRLGS